MLKILSPVGVPSAVIALMSIFVSVRAHSEPAKKRYYQARGLVSDQTGKPVADASVYLVNQYNSSSRRGEKTVEVTTDEHGLYVADGLRRGVGGGITTIIAVTAGKPVAFRRAAFFAPTPKWLGDWTTASIENVLVASSTISSPEKIEPGYYGDLVIPDDGATTRVTVLHHGRPAIGVWVRMVLLGWNQLFERYFPAEAMKHIHPVSRTGPDGVAIFNNLIPGKYTATLIYRPSSSPSLPWIRDLDYERYRSSYSGSSAIEARIEGISAASGLTRNYSMAINPVYRRAFFKPLYPSGMPMSRQSPHTMSHKNTGSHHGPADLRLDENGVGQLEFPSPGLWKVMIRHRAGTPGLQSQEEPFDKGGTMIAVSSMLRSRGPATIHTQHRTTGSVRVRLVDVNGTAQTGQVFVGKLPFEIVVSSALAHGVRLFEGIPSGRYFIRAQQGDISLPDLRDPSNPPDDVALTGRIVYPYEEVNVRAPNESQVLLKGKKVGYLKGKVEFQRPEKPGSIWLSYSGSSAGLNTKMRFDRETGEFLAGPFFPGETELSLKFFSRETLRSEVVAKWMAKVSAERVHRITGHGQKPDAPEPNRRTNWTVVSGTVFTNGGEPAYGAQVLRLVPDRQQAVVAATTDVLGRFRTGGPEMPLSEHPNSKKSVEERFVVVRLPGTCGASIVPLIGAKSQGLNIVLPPALSLSGRVTVGRKPPTVLPANVQVFAKFLGNGSLSQVMDVSTTANHDGTFTLHGLTPGGYTIQASLDSIWVSESTSMEIGEAVPTSGPISLDVPQPGGPVVLRFVDSKGHPVAEEDLLPTLPSGPLTDSIWPKVLKTDVEGYIRLEGFPEGPLKFTLREKHYTVDIPPLLATPRPTQKIVVTED